MICTTCGLYRARTTEWTSAVTGMSYIIQGNECRMCEVISRADTLKWEENVKKLERKPFDDHMRKYEEALQYLKGSGSK